MHMGCLKNDAEGTDYLFYIKFTILEYKRGIKKNKNNGIIFNQVLCHRRCVKKG